MTKVLLDCDTGVDDSMAIMYACLHPAIELVGVGAVWGNVDVATAAHNSKLIVEACGRADVPVAAGAAAPLLGEAQDVAYHVHGRDGQGNHRAAHVPGPLAQVTAAQQIIDVCRAHPGEVELVAVGPLTNLAVALRLCDELPDLVRGVTIMGGAALAPGNVTEVAEANIWHDPEAAQAVFAARWHVTMVGLDVTMRTLLDDAHRARLESGGSLGRYLVRISDHYMRFFADNDFGGQRLSCLHDALAVAVATDTVEITVAPRTTVRVDTGDGPGRGQTLCDLRGRYSGYAPRGRHRVVLESDLSFGDALVALIAAAGDSPIDLSEAS